MRTTERIRRARAHSRLLVVPVAAVLLGAAAVGTTATDPPADAADESAVLRIGGGELDERQELLVGLAEEYVDAWHTGDPTDVVERFDTDGRLEIVWGGDRGLQELFAEDGTLADFVERGHGWVSLQRLESMLVGDDVVMFSHHWAASEHENVLYFTDDDEPVIERHVMVP
ncbi:MAG: hypothetical protein S0880_21715 [Actinomycetota bacterium]|nr:hypothetical protein [Actinomycetota bacterium]